MEAFDLSQLQQRTEFTLLGGPAHGQSREVANGENKLTLMVSPDGKSVPQPVTYIRRTIQAQTPNGVFERTLFVEQSLPVEYASQALQALLLENFAAELLRQWIEGGTPIGFDNE